MPRYFEFDVALCEVEPRIWRRFLLRDTATFAELHEAIQHACGWWNYHLYQFSTPDGKYIAAIEAAELEEPVPDAALLPVRAYFKTGGQVCVYEYDFGDSWQHQVRLAGVTVLPEAFFRRLLGGARAFPHEDSGSLPGYEECVEVAMGRRKDAELREWMGGWHPEHFDLKAGQQVFDRRKRARSQRR